MKSKFRLILSAIPLLVLTACATTSTEVSSSWKAPQQAGLLQRVLIIGVAAIPDTRALFESEFTDALNKHGVTAFPSYTLITSTGVPDRAAIDAVIKERNIDTVLITRLVEKKDVQQYVPGATYPATDPFYSDWYGFYGTAYNYSPGYTIENKVVVLQTNLYNAAKGALQWSATSNTTTQANRAEVIKSFIGAMIKKMQKDNLIKQ